MSSEGGLRNAAAPAALLAVVLAPFHRLLLGETLFFRDLYLLCIPVYAQAAAAIRSGSLALWDPFRHGGQPALGPQTGLFSPTFLPFLVLSPVTAMNLVLAGHAVLAAFGARFLARRLGLSAPAAWAAGAIYALSGYLLSAINLHQPLAGLAWCPLAAGLAVGFVREGGARRIAGLALALAIPLLATSADTVAVAAAFVLLFALCPPEGPAIPVPRRLAGVALAFALAAGLSAVQLLPAAEKVRESSRARGVTYRSFTFSSVDPRRLPELAVPGFLGPVDTLRDEDYWGRRLEDPGFPFFLSLYLGALGLALAGSGALARDGPLPASLRRALAAAAALGLVLSLGRHLPLFPLLYEVAGPLRSFRYPVKAMALLPLPVALLAGGALHRIGEGAGRPTRLALLPLLAGGALVAAAAGVFLLPGPAAAFETAWFLQPLEPAARRALAAALLHAGLFASLGGLLWLRAAGRRSEGTAWAIAALAAGDLLLAAFPLLPTAPRALLSPPPARTGGRGAGRRGEALPGGRPARPPRRRADQRARPPGAPQRVDAPLLHGGGVRDPCRLPRRLRPPRPPQDRGARREASEGALAAAPRRSPRGRGERRGVLEPARPPGLS
jgi:hypothetical protein